MQCLMDTYLTPHIELKRKFKILVIDFHLSKINEGLMNIHQLSRVVYAVLLKFRNGTNAYMLVNVFAQGPVEIFE